MTLKKVNVGALWKTLCNQSWVTLLVFTKIEGEGKTGYSCMIFMLKTIIFNLLNETESEICCKTDLEKWRPKLKK